MNQQKNQTKKIVELCSLAGEIMLKSGAETNRVEDTMIRMATSFGIENPQSFVTPTAIIFSFDKNDSAKLIRVAERSTDLKKVVMVNDISRKISNGELSVDEAITDLREISKVNVAYPLWIQIIAAAITSGSFLLMFKGTWHDLLPAIIAGGAGYAVFVYLHIILKIKFFSECLSSFVIGFIALLSVKTGFGLQIDKIIIASVMPLVPGVLITNAVRDLMDGHLFSALSKGADSFLTALAIGTGIAVIIVFY